MRNRYYFVATKTCVRDAISLAKLKKKGLVDIYEYYEQQRDKLLKSNETAQCRMAC